MPRPDFRPTVFCGSFFDDKADLSFLGVRWGHKLADSIKDHFKLGVVLFLQRLKFPSQVLVSGHHFPKPHKSPHDFDIHLNSTVTVENGDSMATPCSVKTSGAYRRPPRPLFEVADCDLKDSTSSGVNWNMKSAGNLAIFRRTCSLSRLVVTPYSTARSLSSRTLCPRINRIEPSIRSAETKGQGEGHPRPRNLDTVRQYMKFNDASLKQVSRCALRFRWVKRAGRARWRAASLSSGRGSIPCCF